MRQMVIIFCSLLTLWPSQSKCAPSSEMFSWEKNAGDLSLNSELSLYSDELHSTTTEVPTTALYTNLKEFEDKRCNIIIFGISGTEGVNLLEARQVIIKLLRLTNIPFDDSEIVEIRMLPRVREYSASPVLVRFSSAQLQRAIMYNKDRVHPVKMEYDLTKRTIEKQKRLIPLRNRLLNVDIPCFIKLGKLYAKGRPLQSHEVTELAEYYGVSLANTVPPPV